MVWTASRPWAAPSRPTLRAPGAVTPLLRLIALIALAILIVVLLAVWIEGCSAQAKRDRYADYMAEIAAVGNASARLGQDVNTLLLSPGLNAGGPGREARRLHPDG